MKLSDFKLFIELAIPLASIVSAVVAIMGSFMTRSFQAYSIIFIIGFIFFLSSCGFNALNAITDVEADKISRPTRPLPSSRISLKKAINFLILLYLLCFLLIISLTFLWSSKSTIILIIADIALTIFYSIPPRIKNFPLLSNVIVGLHYSTLPMLAGWLLFKPFHEAPFSIILVITLLASGVNILEDFEDIEGDRLTNAKTLPILLGKKSTIMILNSFYSIALIISILNWLIFHLPYWAIAIPLEVFLMFINLKLISTELNAFIAHRILNKSAILAIIISLILMIGFILL
ncbi:MAG: UbiA family prenyltransferase [Candidatus Bathyarchaeia archaeon]